MNAGGRPVGDERQIGLDREGLPAPFIPPGYGTAWDYPYGPPPFIDGHTLDWDNTPFEYDSIYEVVDRQDAQPPLPWQYIYPSRHPHTFTPKETANEPPSFLKRLLFVLNFGAMLGIVFLGIERLYRFGRGYLKVCLVRLIRTVNSTKDQLINTIRLTSNHTELFDSLRDLTIAPELTSPVPRPSSQFMLIQRLYQVSKMHRLLQRDVQKRTSIARLRKFLFWRRSKRRKRLVKFSRFQGLFGFPRGVVRRLRVKIRIPLIWFRTREGTYFWRLFRISMADVIRRGMMFGMFAVGSYYTVVWTLDKVTSWIFHPKHDDKTLYKARKKHIKREIAELSMHNALTTDVEAYLQRANFHKQGNQMLEWLGTHVSRVFTDPRLTFQPRGWPEFFREELRKFQLKKRDFIEWCDRNRKVFIVVGTGLGMMWLGHRLPIPWYKKVRYLAPVTILVFTYFYGTKWPSPRFFNKPPRVPPLGQHESDYDVFRFIPFLRKTRDIAYNRLNYLTKESDKSAQK
jgi:hypothetical protein